MNKVYGTRDILRNPSLLRIAPDENIIIEDKKAHKRLGVYLGVDLATITDEELLLIEDGIKVMLGLNASS